MTDALRSPGPLERVAEGWILGNPGRPGGGAWVEFRPDGLCAHARDSSQELVPWPRIMLGMGLVIGGRYPAKSETVTVLGMLAGLPGPLRGRRGGWLHMTLRHPYEDHSVFFDRHPRWYRLADLAFLEALLSRLVSEGEIHRLADTAWMDRAIARVPPMKVMTSRRALRELLTEVVREGAGRSEA